MYKVLMAHHLRQLPCRRPVHVLDHVEVGREENVKVPLVDLLRLARNGLTEYQPTNGVDTVTGRLM